ncbi:MAG: transporter substrate-binding domain-containing protein, partial [Bdellovibrionota bacterium]|nr:transporter substrate-binding domain-containing protein [Bdellovibrionota bacterium]
SSCETIRVSAHSAYPPYHWYDGEKFTGASIESAKLIFEKLGVKFKFVHRGPWKRVLESAKDNTVDVILGLKNSTDRKRYLSFTEDHFYQNPFAVYAHKNTFHNYKGVDELIGKKGILNLGDRFGDSFDKFIVDKLNVTRVKSMKQAFNLILGGRFDYYVMGFFPASEFLSRNPNYSEIKSLEPFVNEDFIYHGFVKKSPCVKYIKEVSKALAEQTRDGVIQKLIEKYQKIRKGESYDLFD